jgi:hypothetical protein
MIFVDQPKPIILEECNIFKPSPMTIRGRNFVSSYGERENVFPSSWGSKCLLKPKLEGN